MWKSSTLRRMLLDQSSTLKMLVDIIGLASFFSSVIILLDVLQSILSK